MKEYNGEKERKGGRRKEKSDGMKQEEEDAGLLSYGTFLTILHLSSFNYSRITAATTIQFKSSVSIDSFNCSVLVSGRALIRI